MWCNHPLSERNKNSSGMEDGDKEGSLTKFGKRWDRQYRGAS